MNGSFASWTTGIDAGSSTQLSAFWKKRLAKLPELHAADQAVSRFRVALLLLAGVTALALPAVERTRAIAGGADVDGAAAEDKQETPPVERRQAQPAPPGGPVVVPLPGGVTATLIGVADHTAKEKKWWAPDGTPIAAPYASFDARDKPRANQIAREFAVDFQVPAGADVTRRFRTAPSDGRTGGTPRDADGNPIRSISAASVVLPAEERTCSVILTVAAGDWHTIAETNGKGYFSRSTGDHTFVFTKAILADDQVVIAIANDYVGHDLRIVALDNDGEIITSGGWAKGTGRGFSQLTAIFYGLDMADVGKFLLQARPFHHVEIRDVALRAGQATKPTTLDLGTQPREE